MSRALVFVGASALGGAGLLYVARQRDAEAVSKGAAVSFPLSCRCGAFTAQMSSMASPVPRSTNIVCYCKDCQRFARTLETRGGAPSMDSAGGSHMGLIPKTFIRITGGADQLQLAKLSSSSPLTRVYTRCCNTPVAGVYGDPFGTMLPAMGIYAVLAQDPAIFAGPKTRVNVASAHGNVAQALAGADDVMCDGLPPARAAIGVVGAYLHAALLGRSAPNPLEGTNNMSREVEIV